MSRLHSIMYKIPMNDNPNSQWMLDLSANDSSRTKWRKKKPDSEMNVITFINLIFTVH